MRIKEMVDDCGGASALAKNIGVSRTTPYRWINQGALSSRALNKIKAAYPTLDMNKYFSEEEHDGNNKKRDKPSS